ncbi:hypothetical protein ABTN76_20715, partial [Acinetobacter baumannii]
GVHPFEPTTAEAITIDIVTPEEAPPLPKEPDYDFPTLSDKSQDSDMSRQQASAEKQAAQEESQQAAPEPPKPAPAPPTKPK